MSPLGSYTNSSPIRAEKRIKKKMPTAASTAAKIFTPTKVKVELTLIVPTQTILDYVSSTDPNESMKSDLKDSLEEELGTKLDDFKYLGIVPKESSESKDSKTKA
jgi:hypothetical protein